MTISSFKFKLKTAFMALRKFVVSAAQQIRNLAQQITKRGFWLEHGIVFLTYLLLTIAITWPLLSNFTTKITGAGDAVQITWFLWHLKMAFLGQEPFFSTSLLYYPYGATLVTVPLYPIMGLFAMPFWPLGAEAAYNGTMLISIVLTGYCMYLLARGLGFKPIVSLFAGVLLIVAPIHITAIFGHLTKAFLGSLPLFLLTLHYALDIKRNIWWVVVSAFALLLVLLTSVEQMAFAGLALNYFILFALVTTDRTQRWSLIQRVAVLAIVTLILISWFIPMVLKASSDPLALVNTSAESYYHQPDLIQFFTPAFFNQLLGTFFWKRFHGYILSPIETSVFLFWTGILLSLIGFIKGSSQTRKWVLFTLFCILFALGPDLKVMNKHFLKLPYALFAYLPGYQSMRTPGRIMLLGSVGLGISAAYGLSWLLQELPIKIGNLVAVFIIGLILLESWPQQPWPQTAFRPVPDFYQQLSYDPQQYGVFDLPLRPHRDIGYNSAYFIYSMHYQWYQMTHNKSIASAYINRPYSVHPVFGHFISNSVNDSPFLSHIMVNGKSANRYANTRYELARNNYRYVVFHKPQDYYTDYTKGSWGEGAAKNFIENIFGQEKPLVDNDLVTVYDIGTITDTVKLVTTNIAPMESQLDVYEEYITGEHRMTSPSSFYVASPSPTPAYMEINLDWIQNHCTDSMLEGTFITLHYGDFSTSAKIRSGKTTTLKFTLLPDNNLMTLTLGKGNRSNNIPSCFKFKINKINLKTQDN